MEFAQQVARTEVVRKAVAPYVAGADARGVAPIEVDRNKTPADEVAQTSGADQGAPELPCSEGRLEAGSSRLD